MLKQGGSNATPLFKASSFIKEVTGFFKVIENRIAVCGQGFFQGRFLPSSRMSR